MNLLIAICGCHKYEDEGLHVPIRETWLRDVNRLGIDYKFFFGVTGNNKPTVYTVQRSLRWKPRRTDHNTNDIITLNVPDDYQHLALKTREIHKWAYEHGYDFVYMCFSDTYVCVDRLLHCGFENTDYFGNFSPGFFCCGGQGHFLSKKACSYIMNEPVDWRVGPWHSNWCEGNEGAEDVWIGMVLKNHPDIIRGHSDDFVFKGQITRGPTKTDTVITSHLSSPDENVHGGYKPEFMYQKYKEYVESFQ